VPKVVTYHSADTILRWANSCHTCLPFDLDTVAIAAQQDRSPEWLRGRIKEEESESLPTLVLGHTRSENNKKHLIYRCHHLS
jgi:hypothetical protein